MRDDRWQEWVDDELRDKALAKRAGFDDVDQWVDALNDAAKILQEANDEQLPMDAGITGTTGAGR